MQTPAELVQLLSSIARGDQAAFEQLYDATRAQLYGVVTRILRRHDLAGEVLQEAYLRVWHNAGKFDPAIASPMSWMIAVARNLAIDNARKNTDASLGEEPEETDVTADATHPPTQLEMTDELQQLLACIGKLEPERQRLVLLAYYDGWSREQLAMKFDEPADTIKTWLRCSLIAIRECLEQ
jgi:RNA polymerase sigma-70 factor (ECF subfamily)